MTLQVDDFTTLRQAMVTALRDEGLITTEAVAAAMMAVPRHDFAPGELLEKVYQTNTTLVPKIDAQGRQTSVVSASHIQAIQLEQADVRPGMNVLEIGSGGYNAALIAEMVGPTGSATTVDIDADVIDRARAGLQRAGYEQVNVILADAEHGVSQYAPFDRIIVTVGAWDIPPAWLDQLTPDGRIVVPLRFAGITRLIAFARTPDDHVLTADNYRLGKFVPMQGDGAADEQLIAVTPDVGLRVDQSSDLTFDVPALRKALHTAPVESWSGTPFDMPDELELYLLTSGPELPMLHAAQEAVDQGVVNRTVRLGTPALVRGDTFAYRIKRENPDTVSGYETGVIAHGPQADQVASELLDMIRTWAGRYFRRNAARITYHPNTADASGLTGWHTTKRHGVLAVNWS
ncbi:protein-L-isoaspartate(D-aspartate) O-methyltransferase [Micromonospora matsumotoense]|uniref:Protein-L-isoaspartate O-methyltransferase n=1 Tax=Micromonospora matsumotoense TaxID=121616 RepID=A0A1C5AUA8_9ACTN|nr:methyltransferase, FxLD system [Micromonospora matsumotoense]SCF48753.1 protein-L-isoaspartate(D-aspartate) O-methyltransferase [Micromonospora matsumotoense]